MKPRHAFLLISGLALAPAASGQGTFAFENYEGKVTLWNGTPIEGSNYLIDVLVKNPLTGEFTQTGLSRTLNTPSGAPTAPIPVLPISPLSGANAGHFEGGSIRVDFIAPEHPASIRIIGHALLP